jgi:two-component system sensor histidine kinase KdpD
MRLQQLLLNLLENALRAGADGTEVRVGLRATPGAVTISVADRGPGIPRELGERIFDRFTTTPGARGGLGLGLPIARAIARAHGGRLTAADRPGGGAELTLTLPASPTSSNSHRRLRAISPPGHSLAPKGKPR